MKLICVLSILIKCFGATQVLEIESEPGRNHPIVEDDPPPDRQTNKYKSAAHSTLEMPYSWQFKDIGTGVQSIDASQKSCPFDLTHKLQISSLSGTVSKGEIKRSISTNSEERSTAIKQSISASVGFWFFKAQCKMLDANDENSSLDSISMIASRTIDLGTKNLQQGFYPEFTEDAEQMLCNDGPERFKKTYGDYFVSGHKFGSSIRIEVIVKTNKVSHNKKKEIAASLEASFNKFGASVGGGFEESIKSQTQTKSIKVAVTTMGNNVGTGIRSLSLDDAENELVRFATYSTDGTKLVTLLTHYSSHPTYIKLQKQCGFQVKDDIPNDQTLNDILYKEYTSTKWIILQIQVNSKDLGKVWMDLLKKAVNHKQKLEDLDLERVQNFQQIEEYIGISDEIQKMIVENLEIKKENDAKMMNYTEIYFYDSNNGYTFDKEKWIKFVQDKYGNGSNTNACKDLNHELKNYKSSFQWSCYLFEVENVGDIKLASHRSYYQYGLVQLIFRVGNTIYQIQGN